MFVFLCCCDIFRVRVLLRTVSFHPSLSCVVPDLFSSPFLVLLLPTPLPVSIDPSLVVLYRCTGSFFLSLCVVAILFVFVFSVRPYLSIRLFIVSYGIFLPLSLHRLLLLYPAVHTLHNNNDARKKDDDETKTKLGPATTAKVRKIRREERSGVE